MKRAVPTLRFPNRKPRFPQAGLSLVRCHRILRSVYPCRIQRGQDILLNQFLEELVVKRRARLRRRRGQS
jgi:hypothetical protein